MVAHKLCRCVFEMGILCNSLKADAVCGYESVCETETLQNMRS